MYWLDGLFGKVVVTEPIWGSSHAALSVVVIWKFNEIIDEGVMKYHVPLPLLNGFVRSVAGSSLDRLRPTRNFNPESRTPVFRGGQGGRKGDDLETVS